MKSQGTQSNLLGQERVWSQVTCIGYVDPVPLVDRAGQLLDQPRHPGRLRVDAPMNYTSHVTVLKRPWLVADLSVLQHG
jgi:hypothetical protein